MDLHTAPTTMVDGPTYPPMFESLTARQRELIASCDATGEGLQAVLLAELSWVKEIATASPAPGTVSITVEPKGAQPSAELLRECQALAEAAIGTPGVSVTVAVGKVPTHPATPVEHPLITILTNQASRAGVNDPGVRRVLEEDEDFFRAARERGFAYRDSSEPQETASAVFLSNAAHGDLRQLLAFTETIYISADALLADEGAFGCTHDELATAVHTGRCVPIFDRRLGEYDQTKLGRLIESPRFIRPRQLTVRIASDLLSANPLWRLASEEPLLVRESIRAVRAAIEQAGQVENLSRYVAGWSALQRDGAAAVHAAILNQGTLAPVRYGPGALAGHVIFGDSGSDEQRGMLGYLGRPYAIARALGAACVPVKGTRFDGLVDLIANFAAPRRIDSLSEPEVFRELDTLMDSISIQCPTDVPIAEWIEALSTERVRELRASLSPVFSDCHAESSNVRAKAHELAQEIRKIRDTRKAIGDRVEQLELVGVVSDTAAFALDTGFPLTGTLLGAFLKRGIPLVWHALERDKTLRAAREALEAKNALSTPQAVRILRISTQIENDLREQRA